MSGRSCSDDDSSGHDAICRKSHSRGGVTGTDTGEEGADHNTIGLLDEVIIAKVFVAILPSTEENASFTVKKGVRCVQEDTVSYTPSIIFQATYSLVRKSKTTVRDWPSPFSFRGVCSLLTCQSFLQLLFWKNVNLSCITRMRQNR